MTERKSLLLAAGAYFILTSLVAFFLTVFDKRNARLGRRRVSEKTLFLWAFLGGSLAEFVTMKVIRHKTLHKRFMLGLPLIMLLQVAAAVAVYYLFFSLNARQF